MMFYQMEKHRLKLTPMIILNSYYSDYGSDKKVFVLTQEKALAAFAQKDCPFNHIRLLVVDEIQNVERVANDDEQRAKMLYDVIMDFRFQQDVDKIIVAGPRINNLKEMASSIFSEVAEEVNTDSSPVANLTYAIYKRNT